MAERGGHPGNPGDQIACSCSAEHCLYLALLATSSHRRANETEGSRDLRAFHLTSNSNSPSPRSLVSTQPLQPAMTTDPSIQDPLVALRRAIAAGSLPTPTTSPDPAVQDPSKATDDLSAATHLFFREPAPQTIPLTAATRFVSGSSDSAVDLRSIFFAWQKKDVAIPEYIASATELNEALKEKQPQPQAGEEGGQSPVQVQNLVFVERLDLITWLEGASDDSEYIKPLEGAAAAAVAAAAAAEAAADAASAQAQASANIASGAAGGVSAVTGAGAPAAVQAPAGAGAGGAGRAAAKTIDPRLQEIYNGERKMGDRNSVLRGIKPTVCVLFLRVWFG